LKHILILALVFAAGRLSSADEIVLKDGKTILWRSLVDQGQDYEVTQPDGKKLTVRKAEIERVTVDPSEAPLAGATFTKIAGKVKTVNALAQIDGKRDLIAPPHCKLEPSGTSLICDLRNDAPTWVGVGVRTPLEYDFTMVLERADGVSNFYVSLVGGGGTPFLVMLDDDGKCGLWGQKMTTGAALPRGEKVTLEILVRKDSISVRANEKEIAVWRGKWTELALPPTHVPAKGKGLPFVGSQKIPGTVPNLWTIHRMTFSMN
jgi:hypothetical protein